MEKVSFEVCKFILSRIYYVVERRGGNLKYGLFGKELRKEAKGRGVRVKRRELKRNLVYLIEHGFLARSRRNYFTLTDEGAREVEKDFPTLRIL